MTSCWCSLGVIISMEEVLRLLAAEAAEEASWVWSPPSLMLPLRTRRTLNLPVRFRLLVSPGIFEAAMEDWLLTLVLTVLLLEVDGLE